MPSTINVLKCKLVLFLNPKIKVRANRDLKKQINDSPSATEITSCLSDVSSSSVTEPSFWGG